MNTPPKAQAVTVKMTAAHRAYFQAVNRETGRLAVEHNISIPEAVSIVCEVAATQIAALVCAVRLGGPKNITPEDVQAVNALTSKKIGEAIESIWAMGRQP